MNKNKEKEYVAKNDVKNTSRRRGNNIPAGCMNRARRHQDPRRPLAFFPG